MTQPVPEQDIHPAYADWVLWYVYFFTAASLLLCGVLLITFVDHESFSLDTRTAADEITYAVSHAAGWIIVTLLWLGIPVLLLLKQICAVLTFRHAQSSPAPARSNDGGGVRVSGRTG